MREIPAPKRLFARQRSKSMPLSQNSKCELSRLKSHLSRHYDAKVDLLLKIERFFYERTCHRRGRAVYKYLVVAPPGRLELPHPKIPDFEPTASTISLLIVNILDNLGNIGHLINFTNCVKKENAMKLERLFLWSWF